VFFLLGPATGLALACHQSSAAATGVGTAVAGGRGRRLADGRLRYDLAWLAYFGLQHCHAARYRAGHIFWLGTPTCTARPAPRAQHTGIQDGWNLGWKLP
jgi:hypothetical protein